MEGGREGLAGPNQWVTPYTKILIQPAQKGHRFRYLCEGPGGRILGENSTEKNKTYPTIQVVNYRGPAIVIVSCVTKDLPYRPHPHKLFIGRESPKNGICTASVNTESMICSFSNLGILCVKRAEIDESLLERRKVKVDPFQTNSIPMNDSEDNFDSNTVRLCFQVFLNNNLDGAFTIPLQPVVSKPIVNIRKLHNLVICRLNPCTASALGGVEVIILCSKIDKNDIKVKFYEEQAGQEGWHDYGLFGPSDVHSQVAISFKTPKYRNTNLQHPVSVFVQLQRPSDGETSEPRRFQFLPTYSDEDMIERKRKTARTLNRYIKDNTEHVVITNNQNGLSKSHSAPTLSVNLSLPSPEFPQVSFQQTTANCVIPNPWTNPPVDKVPSSAHPVATSGSRGPGPGPSPTNIDVYLVPPLENGAINATPSTSKEAQGSGRNWIDQHKPEVPSVSNVDMFANSCQQGFDDSSTHTSFDLGSLDLSIFNSYFNDPIQCLDVDHLRDALQSPWVDS